MKPRPTFSPFLIFHLSSLIFSLLLPAQDGIMPSKSERIATLADTRIKESSGLARSQRHEGIFWTLNDSGGEPCVFAIDLQGRTRAKVRIQDAANFDWEDLASGLDEQNQPVLYIGDIGDNLHIRPTVQVYRVPEPSIAAAGEVVPETISGPSMHWHLTYPGGPRNAEGLLVHPKTRRLHVMSKAEDGRSVLYAFPAGVEPLAEADQGAENKHKPVLLEKVGEVSFPGHERVGKRPTDDRLCTGAAFSPDGTHLAASTYSSLYEWQLPAGKPTVEALAAKPLRLVPELLRQLEAITYDADSRTLWLTSEHLPTPLVRVSR
jgi:hypothetical protein